MASKFRKSVHVITGGVVSSTVMVWIPGLIFPLPSVATHVLLMVYLLGQLPCIIVSVMLIETGPQLSEAVGVPVAPGEVSSKGPHSSSRSGGNVSHSGDVWSLMVTTSTALTEFPELSVKVQITLCVPFAVIGNSVAVVPVMIPEQMSVVVGAVSVTEHSSLTLGNVGINGGVIS